MPETGVSALEGDLRRRGAWDEPDEQSDPRSSESGSLGSSESDLIVGHPRPTRSASASPRPVRAAVTAAPSTNGMAARDRVPSRETAPSRQTAATRQTA